jgi:glycosyltransferase involved in cell wall biosynthesis
MILLSHPTGNQNVRNACAAFADAKMLAEFWTTLSWNPEAPVQRVLPRALRALLQRRSFPKSVMSRTHLVPWREIGRLIGGPAGVFSRRESGPFSVDAVCAALDKKVAGRLRRIANCAAVYAYEDCALQTFRAAREEGVARIYDLPIGYWRVGHAIFAEECEREPEWASTLTGTRDSAEKLARKDEELRLAQRVVIASSFTKATLENAPVQATIDVIPYGAPPAIAELRRPADRLKVLFAGSLGQRKGLSYLLEAVAMLKTSVELTLLGRKTVEGCRPLEEAIRKYRWIPTLDHESFLHEMHSHDVLVFPSLFEGFGLVISEAMAQGTPVITTAHTAGPDLIEEGVDGFIVPIRSATAIAEKLDLLASGPERLWAMKAAAQRKARAQDWKIYRRRLVEMAGEVLAERTPMERGGRARNLLS